MHAALKLYIHVAQCHLLFSEGLNPAPRTVKYYSGGCDLQGAHISVCQVALLEKRGTCFLLHFCQGVASFILFLFFCLSPSS